MGIGVGNAAEQIAYYVALDQYLRCEEAVQAVVLLLLAGTDDMTTDAEWKLIETLIEQTKVICAFEIAWQAKQAAEEALLAWGKAKIAREYPEYYATAKEVLDALWECQFPSVRQHLVELCCRLI